jgi:myo-inositol-1(or 4)-monophosphatase
MKHDLQYAIELARGAGKIILEQFGRVQRLTKTHAAATDEAVTETDRASQRLIVEGLRRRFPTDGIIGEESDTGTAITCDISDPMGRVWVIDPIDGTNNFVSGLENFAVCIALLEGGYPVLGVVYDVTRDQMYSSVRNEGAWLNGRQIRVHPGEMDASSILMMTSNLLDKDGRLPAYPTRWLSQTQWKLRILGTAALEAVAVARGVAHGAVTVNGKLWDCAAPAAIVLEAGGCIVDFKGRDIFPFDLRNYAGAKVPFLACAPRAKDVLVEEMNR